MNYDNYLYKEYLENILININKINNIYLLISNHKIDNKFKPIGTETRLYKLINDFNYKKFPMLVDLIIEFNQKNSDKNNKLVIVFDFKNE